ncbi:DUF2059 domain-containing protein [Qipengyuania aurantiaca]|uniref:DUF2059 domain-containing protein n=1 Tax=Qipengyuania aurantiaca TaxID=2867233 RepID=A0ABX8ZN19_9SPHN|nr:DUF2059 domain-containing protein [Qipengyuania aurantiaca]QZD90351.1 DUF2059 domain-containing protein [Qipengyuania aurantiaca]
MTRLISLLAPLAFATGLASAANAQEAEAVASASETSSYDALLDSMLDGLDREQLIDNQLRVAKSFWEADANVVAMEAQHPGLMDAMVRAMRPILIRVDAELQNEYRDDFVAAIAATVTAEEASTIAQFYSSDLGVKMLSGISATYDGKESIAKTLESGAPTNETFDRDTAVTTNHVVQTLSAEEQQELVAQFTSKPALQKLPAIQQAMRPIRIQMERAGMAPERQRVIQEAVRKAAMDHMANS